MLLRRRDVAALRCQGNTIDEIAVAMDVSVSTVCEDLKRWRASLNEELRITREDKVTDESARLLYIYRELMAAWEETKWRDWLGLAKAAGVKGEDAEMRAAYAKAREDGFNGLGDTAYVTEALKALSQYRKLNKLEDGDTIIDERTINILIQQVTPEQALGIPSFAAIRDALAAEFADQPERLVRFVKRLRGEQVDEPIAVRALPLAPN